MLSSGVPAAEYFKEVFKDPNGFCSWLNVTGLDPGPGLPAAGRGWCRPPRFTRKERGMIQKGRTTCSTPDIKII